MKTKLRTTIILIAFVALATWLYPIILGNTAVYLIPSYSLLPKNRYLLVTCMTLGAAIGASLCAFILALPLGYLTKNHPLWQGFAFGVLVVGIKFILFPALFQQFNWFVGTIAIGEDIAFIVASIFFTWWGCRVGNRRKMTAN
jgi:hypothetical protein